MSPHYLQVCLQQFEEISKIRWGKPFNLGAIEEAVRPLQSSRKLTYRNLAYFRDQKHWWFTHYWTLPSPEDVNLKLDGQCFDFWQLSPNNEGSLKERQVLEKLLDAFRSIELVSIILRFIRPDSFGILSPPVERILDVSRGSNAVETYLHYLQNLREIRNHFQGFLPRAADVDMALWALHEKCYEPRVEDRQIREEYDQDPFMWQLRAANLVAPLADLPLTRLAQALQNVRDDLAGLIGCFVLEQKVRKRAGGSKIQVRAREGKYPGLGDYLDALKSHGEISTLEYGKLNRLRDIRNRVFHAEVEKLSPRDLHDLVQAILEMNGEKK